MAKTYKANPLEFAGEPIHDRILAFIGAAVRLGFEPRNVRQTPNSFGRICSWKSKKMCSESMEMSLKRPYVTLS